MFHEKPWVQQPYSWKQQYWEESEGQIPVLPKPCQLHSPPTTISLPMALLYHLTTDLQWYAKVPGMLVFVLISPRLLWSECSPFPHLTFSFFRSSGSSNHTTRKLQYESQSLKFLDHAATYTTTWHLQNFKYCSPSRNTDI